jgi:hypothetical protein
MGVIRTILIIIGVSVIFRFIGQLMNGRRNQEDAKIAKDRQDAIDKQKQYVEKNQGKVNIVSKQAPPSAPFEDVDYEEVKR